jgi:hypothetical protein
MVKVDCGVRLGVTDAIRVGNFVIVGISVSVGALAKTPQDVNVITRIEKTIILFMEFIVTHAFCVILEESAQRFALPACGWVWTMLEV